FAAIAVAARLDARIRPAATAQHTPRPDRQITGRPERHTAPTARAGAGRRLIDWLRHRRAARGRHSAIAISPDGIDFWHFHFLTALFTDQYNF
ncbi:MAG: hypothetical protein NW700_15120, partial [Nitrospiraceae bacterium]